MTRIRRGSVVIGIAVGLAGFLGAADRGHADTLTIGAAHSVKAPLEQILPMFEREHGATVHVVYGPSHTLRRQIEKGAPIDVFLPDAVEEVEQLNKKGLTLNGGPRVFAQTSLVLVMATASTATAISFREALPNRSTRLALGDPKTSALGALTARALAKADPAHRIGFHPLHAEHSEEIMNLIHTGKADAGIVYRVDAINNGQVRIIDETPAGVHTPVRFGHAVVWTCRESSRDVADAFFDFLLTPRIQKLLLQYGFEPVPSIEPAAMVSSE